MITILLLIPIARRISSEKSCRCLTNRHSRDSRNCVARQTRLFSRSKRAKVAVKKRGGFRATPPSRANSSLTFSSKLFDRSVSDRSKNSIVLSNVDSHRVSQLETENSSFVDPSEPMQYPPVLSTRFSNSRALRRIPSLNGRTNRDKKQRRSCFLVIEHACRLPHCSSGNFFHPRDPKRRSFEPPSSRPQDLRSLRPLRSG